VAPGISANRGSVPGPGRSLITPQLCMLSDETGERRGQS
jgi:hypothetical protein